MDIVPESSTLFLWLTQYGSFAIFILLLIGIVAVPVTEETLLVIAGIFMHHGKLSVPSTLIASYLGCLSGISISYLLGRTAGNYLIHKYGKWVGLTPKRHKQAHAWFEKSGKWALLIGYYIPGVRHFTGLSAGTSRMDWKQFSLYAYCGGIIWVSVFLSIGYFFGKQWLTIYEKIHDSLDWISLIIPLVIIGAFLYLFSKYRKQ